MVIYGILDSISFAIVALSSWKDDILEEELKNENGY